VGKGKKEIKKERLFQRGKRKDRRCILSALKKAK
jgi:hypothetical protein